MTKAIIFDTEEHAKQWDRSQNSFTRSVTEHLYKRVMLKGTTTLSKVEYAELFGIPEYFEDEEGNTYENSTYSDLENSYTLHKYGLVVEDNLDTIDEEGNVKPHPDVVDITDMIYQNNDEI